MAWANDFGECRKCFSIMTSERCEHCDRALRREIYQEQLVQAARMEVVIHETQKMLTERDRLEEERKQLASRVSNIMGSMHMLHQPASANEAAVGKECRRIGSISKEVNAVNDRLRQLTSF